MRRDTDIGRKGELFLYHFPMYTRKNDLSIYHVTSRTEKSNTQCKPHRYKSEESNMFAKKRKRELLCLLTLKSANVIAGKNLKILSNPTLPLYA